MSLSTSFKDRTSPSASLTETSSRSLEAEALAPRRNAPDGFAFGGGIGAQKSLGQRPDVFAPVAQGRNNNGEHIQSVIQIFAEPSFGNQHRQFLICRRNHPHIDLLRFAGAHRINFTALQNPQQFDLDLGL
jgi:hypothetical protein